MRTSFQFTALPYEPFASLFSQSDLALEALGARRMIVDETPGFPCRVSLVDADMGETVLLLPFMHHKVGSPYQASGPIFVRRDAVTATPAIDEIPLMFRHRLLSLRGYTAAAMMVRAEVVHGRALEAGLQRLFALDNVTYLHIHNASPGCFNCCVLRA